MRSSWPRGARCWSAPADLPFVTAAAARAALADADARRAPAVVASLPAARLQPLLGCYQPGGAGAARAGAARERRAARARRCAALGPRLARGRATEIELFNVNTPEDLLQAAALLDQRDRRAARARRLAESEVVGADAGRDLDRERVLLRRGQRDERVQPLAADGDAAPSWTSAPASAAGSAGRRAAPAPCAGRCRPRSAPGRRARPGSGR